MPCYDPHVRLPNGEYILKDDMGKYLDKMTRMLCEACQRLDRDDEFKWSEELCDWWWEHKEWDRKRKLKEV